MLQVPQGTPNTDFRMGTLLECRVNSVSVWRCVRGTGASGGVEGHAGGLIAPWVLPKAAGACSAFFQGVEEGFLTPPGGDSGDRSRQAFPRAPHPGSSPLSPETLTTRSSPQTLSHRKGRSTARPGASCPLPGGP